MSNVLSMTDLDKLIATVRHFRDHRGLYDVIGIDCFNNDDASKFSAWMSAYPDVPFFITTIFARQMKEAGDAAIP